MGQSTCRAITRAVKEIAKKLFFFLLEIASFFVRPKKGFILVIPVYGYDGNARAVFERLLAEGLQPAWLSFNSHLTGASVNNISPWSVRGFWSLLRASIIVAEAGLVGVVPRTQRKRRLVVQLWHGVGLKRLGLQDRGKPHRLLRCELEDAGRWDIFLTTSGFCASHFAEAFCLPKDKIKVWGYPRHDRLVNPTEIDWTKLVELEGRISRGFTGTKFVVLFCPTFREDGADKLWPVSEENMHLFARLLLKHHAVCLCKWHPVTYNRWSASASPRLLRNELWSLSPWERLMVLSPEVDMPQWVLLRVGSVLITDFSSIAFDFTLLRRPVLVSASGREIDTFQKARGLIDDWTCHLPGPLVSEDAELLARLDAILSMGPERWSEVNGNFTRVGKTFVETVGTATDQVLEYIRAWLGL